MYTVICSYSPLLQLQSPSAPKSVQQIEETEPANNNPTPSVLSPPSPNPPDSVPSTFESLFTPPALTPEAEWAGGSHTGRKLHVQLPNVSSSHLRRLSDVEECDVQPEVSNFPLRYGQRRPSNASRKVNTGYHDIKKIVVVVLSCIAYSCQTTVTHLAFSTLSHRCWEEVIRRRGIFSMVNQ